MKNNRIYAIGETVFDIIFKDTVPLAAKAGGSMLNTAVSLGRLGLPVNLISELGADEVGKTIINFLNENGVRTRYVNQFDKGNTSIALAFLDHKDDASYSFYHQYPDKRLAGKTPVIGENDMVLFGSYFSITKTVRPELAKFMKHAQKSGAMIMYDPNIRKPHLNELESLKTNIFENIKLADIVRGSDEDFAHIFNTHNPLDTFRELKKHGSPVLIYTRSNKDVAFVSDSFSFTLPVRSVDTVSTIGAGDSFNAGILYTLFKLKISCNEIKSLKRSDWETIINTGITFGSSVCQSTENYISHSIADILKIKK